MIPELGHYALVLALGLGADPVDRAGHRRAARRCRADGARLLDRARAIRLRRACPLPRWPPAMSRPDFSVRNVFENSHSQMPLIYKITGVWGNHEGSMLLWVLILALFGALVAVFGSNLPATPEGQRAGGAVVDRRRPSISSSCSPRTRSCASPSAPFEGRDLNPILQDPGLAIHPPLLYLGYVGFSIAFSFAIAALIEGRIDAAWARWVRPWTLAAWMFLTLGIAMGSYWAYYTLGWGGFWFWDPVENASLMPWLAGTALLHSAVVMEKRNALKVWTILLAILDLLAVADRHLPGALRRAHLGAHLRQRSAPRRLHPRHPGALHRRRAGAVRLARAAAQAGRAVRADLARGRAGVQQPVPHHRVPRRCSSARSIRWRSKR